MCLPHINSQMYLCPLYAPLHTVIAHCSSCTGSAMATATARVVKLLTTASTHALRCMGLGHPTAPQARIRQRTPWSSALGVELTISKARYLRVLARRRLRWRWSPLCLRGQPSVSFDFTSAGTMPSLIWILYCLFSRVTGVQLTNVCCEAEDGKGAADGLSCVVSQGANARSGRRQPWKRCAWPRRAAGCPQTPT